LPSRSVAATSRWIMPSRGPSVCILTGSDETVACTGTCEVSN
jgi:hypothetical protein